jgi:tRNA dimethylallyltransferase
VAPRLIAIVGPTAAGKSALALRLASEWPAEIVSCDSLQVYRGLDVGSAKPSLEERRRVRHHLIDVRDPREGFSAAEFARAARSAIAAIAERGALPLVVGGSGLYFRALFRGIFEGPSRDDAFRARLERLAGRFGDARLHRLLRRVDPASAARIATADRVRVVRALEVYRATGRTIGSHHRRPAEGLAGFDALVVGLDPDRAALRLSVERRSRAMLDGGLLEEAAAVLDSGCPPHTPALRAIGYRQAVALLRGETTQEQALAELVTETMRYAKRQMTWFRREPLVRWFPDAEAAFGAARAFLAPSPGSAPTA